MYNNIIKSKTTSDDSWTRVYIKELEIILVGQWTISVAIKPITLRDCIVWSVWYGVGQEGSGKMEDSWEHLLSRWYYLMGNKIL